MKLFVLFGQRKCTYPDEYAMEALACIDENGHSDNPDYLEGEERSRRESGEFDALRIVTLNVSERDVRQQLYPVLMPIEATVTPGAE